jgi:gamma-glutamylcyclotransferase (GGCT)/AIG2-like uncharacterized protein YtfP
MRSVMRESEEALAAGLLDAQAKAHGDGSKEIDEMENLPDIPILLFSYGTLQDKAVQAANFGRELMGRSDSILGYTQTLVAIRDRKVIATSGKTHHPVIQPSPNPRDEVPGTVFEITAQELAAADEYEVSDYKRVAVPLKSGLQAWVFVRA